LNQILIISAASSSRIYAKPIFLMGGELWLEINTSIEELSLYC
jgi:hypothetical protein